MKKLFSCLLLFAVLCGVHAVTLMSGIKAFRDQPYWNGKANFIEENGEKILELTSSEAKNNHYGRAFSPYSTKENLVAKDKIVATAKVRGKGKFFIGLLKYRPKGGMPVTLFTEPINLTETVQEVKFVFELEEAFAKVYPYFQILGDSIAYVESFKLEKDNDTELKVSKVTPPTYGVAKPKTAVKKNPNILLMESKAIFRDQPYWGGKAKMVTENGKSFLELTSSVRGHRYFGRAFAPFSTRELFLPDSELIATVRVRGKGKFFAGLLKYLPNGTGAPVLAESTPVDLSDTVKEFKFKFTLEKLYDRVYPFVQINDESIAYIEYFRLEKVIDPSVKITAETQLQIITENDTAAPVIFSTSLKNTEINIFKFNGKNKSEEKIKTDANGKLTLHGAKYQQGTTHICTAAKGIGVKNFIKVISKEEYSNTDSIASEIKLKKPVRMLMLGDSLSDFYRGYNYIDRLNFWINKHNPGKFTFHNAGVGGDFCERASTRMEFELKHNPKSAYRQEMYSGIFKDEYDYIFIFMGQNDTRCMPKDNYSTPETTPEEQQKYLSLMVKRLKENCPKAKIVLISPSPSNEAHFEALLANGKKPAFYGRKKFVDTYDQINRQFCKENKLDYVDILSVIRNHKPLKDIYVTDGVHLSEEGGRVIADELLKYFAKECK